MFAGCDGGPRPTDFQRKTPIPLGPVTVAVMDAEIRSQADHEAFHAALTFRGITFPRENRWVVVLLRTTGIDSYRKMERFLGVVKGKLALVDRSGTRYPSLPLMDAGTYLFFRGTSAREYTAELGALSAHMLAALRTSAQADDLQALRSFMDIRANMMMLIMDEDNDLKRPPVPQDYVAMFSVPPARSELSLYIDNPDSREEQPRTARVSLGL